MLGGLFASVLAFTTWPHAVPSQRPLQQCQRSRPLFANDQFPERDPEVEKATDISNYLPSRFGLTVAGLVGATCVLFPDSPVGKALIAPPIQTNKKDKVYEDTGIVYGKSETLAPSGGLLVLGGYVLARQYVRPRMERAARERREEEEAARRNQEEDGGAP